MKKLKLLGLTLFLSIGFIIPSCDIGPVDSCDGVVFKVFFDMNGISAFSYTDFQSGKGISLNDTIDFNQLDKIHIDYLVDYVASVQEKSDWSFSMMPMANACSYIPGSNGSKEEALVNFTITTLNDFDSEHLANASINDLFDFHGSFFNPLQTPIPLSQFLAAQTEKLQEEDMLLELKKAPELNQEFKFKVEMELSTGEIYDFESLPFFINP